MQKIGSISIQTGSKYYIASAIIGGQKVEAGFWRKPSYSRALRTLTSLAKQKQI